MRELVKKFKELFIGLERSHGTYQIPKDAVPNPETGKIKGKGITVHHPADDSVWMEHLQGGRRGVGKVPVNEKGLCVWGALDIDKYDVDLYQLEQKINELELPLLLCRSKSGGPQLYIFFSEPVSATILRKKLSEFSDALGYSGCEIFPKQNKIDSDNDHGSWINLPYYNTQKTERYCIYNGKKLSAEEFLSIVDQVKLSRKDLENFQIKSITIYDFTDGPPCLQELSKQGFPPGSMNNALFSLGVYAKKKHGEDSWEYLVGEYNRKYLKGNEEEVKNVVKSLKKKEYVYKCSDIPLRDVCNKEECKKRLYGILNANEDEIPCILDEVERPIKVFRPPKDSGDEPSWIFVISGKPLDVTLDMVLDQGRFLKEYTKKFEKIIMPVKMGRWASTMNIILAEADILDQPMDAGPEGQLMLHLETFTSGNIRAQDVSEILLNRPWKDPETDLVWFRSRDFMKYLDQQHFRHFREKEVWTILRGRGGKHQKFEIKGKNVMAWGFKSFSEQKEEFNTVIISDNKPY